MGKSDEKGVPSMAILGEDIESPRELYVHKLGAALKMEKTILEDNLGLSRR